MDAARAVGASADNENEKTFNLDGTQGNLNDAGAICRLLDLAPELRNKIYRYVVCEDENIEVTKDTREPGLLATCRQIRAEARSIWFLENRFEFRIEELNITLLAQFYRRSRKHLKRQTARTHMRTSEHYDWAKLMQWCKAVFERKVWSLVPVPGRRGHNTVVAHATSMTHQHAKIAGSTWETCHEMLQHLRAVAGSADSRWLEDQDMDNENL